LEKAAHQPFAAYMQQHILRPLGMTHTGYTVTSEMEPLVAKRYMYFDATGLTKARYVEYALSAGRMMSSVEDTTRFLSLQFRDAPQGGNQVLGSSTLREMLIPSAGDYDPLEITHPQDISLWMYGMSWLIGIVSDEYVASHNGRVEGGTATFAIVPRLKLGIAIYCNTNGNFTTLRIIAHEVYAKLIPVIKSVLARQAADRLKAMRPRMEPLCGDYSLVQARSFNVQEHPGDPGDLVLTLKDGKLHGVMNIPAFEFKEFIFDLNPYQGDTIYRIVEEDVGGEFVTFERARSQSKVRFKWRDFVFEHK
jgi:CubicO group peptidase (beta-lactamase class C family)